jgi:hypothetical protein
MNDQIYLILFQYAIEILLIIVCCVLLTSIVSE